MLESIFIVKSGLVTEIPSAQWFINKVGLIIVASLNG